MGKAKIFRFDLRYIFPLSLIVFSLFYSLITYFLYEESKGLAYTGLVGPCFFPWLIGLALCALSIWELFSVIKTESLADSSSKLEYQDSGTGRIKGTVRTWLEQKEYLFDIFFLSIVAAYILGMPLLGFLPMSVFFIFVMLWIAGEDKILKLMTYPVLISFMIYYLFVKPLGIPLSLLPWD